MTSTPPVVIDDRPTAQEIATLAALANQRRLQQRESDVKVVQRVLQRAGSR